MKLVMIGHGMVGHKFIESLLEKADDELEVTIIAEEPRIAYDRVHLTEYFSGKTAKDLSLARADFADAYGIDLRLNTKAIAIDPILKTVTTSAGDVIGYDKLILATGSYAFVPPISGNDRNNCFVYRTLEDLDAIRAASKNAKSGVVIGGGLLGLEAAKALRDLNLETHVVEFAPRLMAVQIDDLGGKVLRRKIEDLGVKVHTQKATQCIEDGSTHHHIMKFADGSVLETDIVLFSAGIRPRDELAKISGLATGERGGIVINDYCQTSQPDIYAIGECALWNNKIYGLVAPGYDMARIAAKHILEEETHCFTGADMSTKLKLMGVDVASIGDAHAMTPNALSYFYADEDALIYKKIVVNAEKTQLLGAVLVGDAKEYSDLLQMMLNGMALPEQPESLIMPGFSEAGAAKSGGSGVDLLPDSATICSCNNVSKADICQAIEDGSTSLGALKKCTKAATACGGCAPLVTQVLKSELQRQGVTVNNHLCEHFAYSRQELYHLVRVNEIKTFDDLIEQHGHGLGCDICKPTVANILASCWNDFVLKPSHAGLQDSNDYYLGNIQKDGSYSVVPRMAGGEVTPDGLIAVGQIAKKYNLYTKITGGQRVDMFGAQLHELPLIWEELIAAGFESGHAYGKSLRTVKSCVGSTWCRYGVDDSVGLAIFLENRYKGLRSPHKLKMAVSGCTRECAEAQGKDVGVIATEKGWNLYVCGNGGMKPRHAELLASDLDTNTLIRYIDRFFMFYIQTADRLQRTSVWRDNMEGGLDYLKAVIVEDSLGLAHELERRMSHVVNTYQDEWRTAVEDPDVRKRFQTFINQKEQRDPHIQFTEERGQIRPLKASERDESRIPLVEA
ncbi:nitrite reductase (NADH) large subunit [Acinetobacter baylyi]|uniref:Nitrite reductase (NADH) large subunit n=1 Tax=Acinetobacter baylyi TaxID=202950 RepID=A0ABU0USA1_ACIBI|nr:nitrite reductase large subunit NirB [Acinetobacter baylyi]MDQ1207417.1 nitrite reductase (NADH) large subunit [Acinetobacter baylyi]MDR6105502.1 nitrite reductase (NADH) large subunit [Acinetobacter baylyi]MDR6184288.1 nitrite reductase (NADH) large subunit [Acinetobacter baylyi]